MGLAWASLLSGEVAVHGSVGGVFNRRDFLHPQLQVQPQSQLGASGCEKNKKKSQAIRMVFDKIYENYTTY